MMSFPKYKNYPESGCGKASTGLAPPIRPISEKE